MRSYKVARRAFLSGLGGSAALLLPLLRNIEARAAGAAAPLRFLVIHHPLGTQWDSWRPSAKATTTSFTLPSNSAPFNPLKSKMVMIDGLNIASATRNGDGVDGANTHEGGMVALMTGQPTLGRIGTQDHAAGGASIDQIFLAKSALLGGPQLAQNERTPFGSLQLAADIRSDRDEVAPRVMSYLDPNPKQSDPSLARHPLYPETQPLNVYNRLFAGPVTGGSAAQAAAALAQKKSILDFMRGDLSRMRTLVPASEKVKLDAQADAIQQLEASIVGSGMASSSCIKPSAPMSFTESGKGPQPSDGGNAPNGGSSKLSGVDYYDSKDPNDHPHQVLGQLQLSMIKAAFSCDLVRVSTFMWSAGTNWVVFPGSFDGGTLGSSPSPHHPPSHTTDPATVGWLSKIDTFYSNQSSLALQAFDAVVDVDGNSLLDNTVVVYVTEVARASDHDQRNVPMLVFGGKNTGIKGGTFLKATGGPLASIDSASGNRPTNDLWLALAPIFGVSLPSLGAAKQYTGPLQGLVG